MNVRLSQRGVSVKQTAPTLKGVSSVSVHLVSMVMEGVMEMDAQVGNHRYWRGIKRFSHYCRILFVVS